MFAAQREPWNQLVGSVQPSFVFVWESSERRSDVAQVGLEATMELALLMLPPSSLAGMPA